MDVSAVTSSFAQISTDWLIFAGVFIIVALYSLRSGYSRAISLSLALPITAAAYAALPDTRFLSDIFDQISSSFIQGVVALIVLALFFSIIDRMTNSFGDNAKPVPSILVGACVAVLFVTFWIAIPPLSGLWQFGPPLSTIFGESYRLWVLLFAYALLAFVRR